MFAIANLFWTPRGGNDEDEHEDSASTQAVAVSRSGGRGFRFAVADGASSGYDPGAWAKQLVRSFAPGFEPEPVAPPDLADTSLERWQAQAQAQWRTKDRVFPNRRARLKFEGAPPSATFLGGRLEELDGERPRWSAVGVGDTVLFHVRGGRLLAQLPALRAEDFGDTPPLLSSDSAQVQYASRHVERADGDLREGDRLFVATDALAAWLVRADASDPATLWGTLARMDDVWFAEIVAGERARGTMPDDDTTLLRIGMATRPPDRVLVRLPTEAQDR